MSKPVFKILFGTFIVGKVKAKAEFAELLDRLETDMCKLSFIASVASLLPNEHVTSRYIDVAFDLPVSAVFSTQKAERSIHFANVTLPGSVLLFDKDEDRRVRSLSRAQIHAIAYFCASFRYSEE